MRVDQLAESRGESGGSVSGQNEATGGKPLRIAVAGCGVVGEGAVLDLLDQSADYEVVSILVRDLAKRRDPAIDRGLFTDSVEAFLGADPDVVIDALSSGEEGFDLTRRALEKGVSIVSANKQALAGELGGLTDIAREREAAFYYSPSVGGGAPIIETVRAAAERGDIVSIEAILNGTVNYILTSLSDGADFEEAVRAAQEAGFAEADPSADLEGLDASAKIRILAFEAFGVEIPEGDVPVEALDEAQRRRIAAEPGAWRQIARVEKDGDALAAAVGFKRVDNDALFSAVLWEGNAVRIACANGETFQTRGRGAGRGPTVKSTLADLKMIRLLQTG